MLAILSHYSISKCLSHVLLNYTNHWPEWRTTRLVPTSLGRVRLTGLWPQTTDHGPRVNPVRTIGEHAQSLGCWHFKRDLDSEYPV